MHCKAEKMETAINIYIHCNTIYIKTQHKFSILNIALLIYLYIFLYFIYTKIPMPAIVKITIPIGITPACGIIPPAVVLSLFTPPTLPLLSGLSIVISSSITSSMFQPFDCQDKI